jgi:DNA-binding response OmpR family regulator
MAKITVVDDDTEFAENVSQLLRNEGFSVNLYYDIEGMIDELIRNMPDLLILDVMFPENPSGGFDLAREIRKTERIKNLPIILLTAINQEFPMDFSSKDIDPAWMPVQDFVEKPVQMGELVTKIKKLLP